MKKRLYKLLAFALSVCMVVGLMPAMTLTARAEEASVVLGSPYGVDGAKTKFTFPKVSVTGDGWKTMTVSISGTGASLDYTTNNADKANAKGDNNSDHQFAVWTWDDEEGKTGEAVATILKNIVFTKGSTDPDVTVELSKGVSTLPEGATVTEGTGDYVGHYYLFVKYGSTVESWLKAYNAAKGTSFMGMKGYLATLTSTAEATYLKKISAEEGWVGGTALLKTDDSRIDEDKSLLENGEGLKLPSRLQKTTNNQESFFYWACGPESGTVISDRNLWNTGEPNANEISSSSVVADQALFSNFKMECCVKANDTSTSGTSGGKLNDISVGNAAGASGDYAAFGYFVEFGGYEEKGKTDPGYNEDLGGGGKPESATGEKTSITENQILLMQTFKFPEDCTVEGEANNNVTDVNSEGRTVTVDPGEPGSGTVTVKPAEGKAFDKSTLESLLQDKNVDVTVNPDGSVTLTFKEGCSSDGVDFSSAVKDIQAKIGDDVYSTVKDALAAANGEDVVELQMNSGLTAVEGADLKSGVTLKTKGAEDGDGNSFTSNSDETKVDVTADGKVTVKPGDANADLQKDGTVTVGETEYTAKGETGAKLHITKEGDADKVELTEGSVEVPANKDITVKGKKVTAGEAAITATTNEDGSATVHVDASQTVTIDGVTYTGEADIVIGNDDSVSVKKGTVNLPHKSGEDEKSVDVTFDGSETPVTVTNPDETNDVTVKVPVSDDNANGQATVKKGGKVDINGTVYTVPAGDESLDDNNIFEFDKNGDVTLKKGGVELGTGDAAVKFGGKDISGTNGSERGKVKVEVEGEKAAVTVPKGGSVEIGGTTYTNNGEDNLELEVDKDGNVTLKSGTVGVPNGGEIKVGDHTYTAGSDGATLTTEDGSEPATLTEGSVILPDGGKVKTKSAGEEVTVSGSVGLEVTAGGDSDKATVKGTGTVGDSVTVQKGDNTHSYALESGDTAEHEIRSEGVIAGLAEELAKGGSTNGSAYGVKRDSAAEGNVYTLTDEDGTIHVTANASSKFTYGEQPAYTSVGTYEVPEGKSASLTADQKGNITLNEGTVKVGKGSGESGTLYVEGIDPEKGKISGDGITVTAPGQDAEGEDIGGADVEVPNDGKVTIGENEYTAKEEGTKLHVAEDGTVTLVEGSIEIPEGQTFEMDGVEYTGKVTVKKDESGVTANFGSDNNTGKVESGATTYTPGTSGDSEVKVDENGTITGTLGTGGNITTEAGEYTTDDSAKFTADNKGNVTLNEGSIKTPEDGGSVKFTTGSDEPADEHIVTGDGVTVTKRDTTGTVSVPQNGEASIDGTTYKNAGSDKALEIEVGGEDAPTLNEEKLPTLKSGAVELDNGETIGVNGATVETTADKVTVTKESDGGNATVDIPEGAKAKINGVEVEGPANVEIDSSGKATVTPNPAEKGASVVVDGVKYVDSSKSGGEGKVTIDEAGRVTAENMNPTVELPTGRIHVPAGQSVSFDDSTGGNTTVTGGDSDGCWIEVAEDGTVTVYEDNNSDNVVGTYKNEGKSDEGDNLQLTVSSESGTAELKGGTVRAEKDSPVKVGEHTYTPGDNGMTLKYPGEEDDNTPTLTDGSVIPAENAPVKVGDNTYTPQSNNVEIGMGTDNNGSVKSNDGEDAQVKFKGEDGTEKDYLVPGTAGTVNGTTTGLPSPAQEKLTAEGETDLGNGAKIKGDAGNGKEPAGDAFFESTTGGGNLTLQPGAKATVTPAGDEAGSKATTYENADPEKDAKLTLDKDGNATLTDGKVKMTGEGAEGKGASVTVNGNTITSKDATVTAPGKNAEGEEETGSADVTIPSGGKASIDGKEYSASDGDLTLHVAPNGDVSLKNGKVGLADDSSIKFGDTEITNPASSGSDNVTVEATGDKANVTVPGGTSNSVKIGDDTYTNADASSDLELEVDTNGDVTLNSGKVTLPDSGDASVKVGDNTVTGNGVTVEKGSSGTDTVEIPSGKTATVTDAEGNENKFTAKDGNAKVELGSDGNMTLTEGSADIGKGTEVTVSGATVENAGPGNVTVEKTEEGGEITIPAGTTATVNGVEVKGPAKVTVGSDGKATVKPEPAEAGKSVTVGGVTYTDDGEGTGSVEIDSTGKVTATNMSAAIEKLPVEGLVVPAGQTLTYKAGGKDVTLKGGEDKDSKIDIAANGDITMESGNLTIKGDVTTKKAADASEGTKWQYVGDVTLKLTDEDGKPFTPKDAAEAKKLVSVKDSNGDPVDLDGDDKIVVNPDGTVTLKDLPYDSYTVTVKSSEAGGTETTTTVTVNGASTTSSMTVETNLTVTTEVDTTAAGDAVTPSAAENLESLVDSGDRQEAAGATSSAEVKIELKVESASSKETEKTGIDAIKGDVNIETNAYVDVTVEKTVTIDGHAEDPETITNTSSLITMRFPVDSKILGSKAINSDNADCIQVFRYHDGSAAKMRKVSPGAGKTANFECYYIEVSPDSTGSITVVVKANKFSVYAFGVAGSAILPQDPSTGGGGGVVAYPVTLPESVDNGTVSANYSSAAPGVTVTLTVTPDDGYTMGSITITDRNGNIIPVTDNGDGTYSFRMPSGGVEVSISFKLSHCDGGDDCPSRAFPDLDVTAWYHEYTDYVIETKLMQGSGGLFKPNGTLTRAEMVTVLWNMNGRGVVNYLMTYGDVSEEDWYAEAIRWATSEGVVDGYDNGNFGPNDKITREQMAKMLYNYEKKYGDGGFTGEWMFPLPFADTAKINDWAYEAVAWCYMNGVINGKDGNVFDPAGNALRCELAKVLTVYNQIDD